ncbi:MAG TPA: head GIN domain-containing protein [Chitinophagaceae bacterium]|nr:head GIN domain-containing protein [Chitinophagaceae bacterium]
MKKLFSMILLSFVAATSQAQLTFNDPNAEVREAKNFHAISVSNAFDVFISQGNDEAVAVSATEEKYKQNIKVEVKDGVLRIWLEKEGKFWKGFNGDKMKLKAYISFKNIDKLTASGACDVHIQGTINADDLSVNISGATDLREGKINAKKLSINASGASDVTLSGSATELDIEANGASDIKGFDFAADYCEVRATGASSITVTVNKELSAHATGASDVHYKGDGLIKEIKASGASNISKRS